jgi:peptidoglycan/xylan/chitin deacetylase (PgdA/CDA1 family)
MKRIYPFIFIPLFVFSISFAITILHQPVKKASLVVICYHSFIGRPEVSTDFSLDELQHHIEILKKRHYRFVTLESLANSEIRGDRNVLITIDDGHRSTYNAYLKVFKPLHIKPLLAIYTQAIGTRNFLTWDQVSELSREGWEISSHGYSHLPLTNHRFQNNPDEVLYEILVSKKIIQDKIPKPVRSFIYPYGVYDFSSVEIVKLSGYKYAFGIDRNIITLPLDKSVQPFNLHTLPRYMLTRKNIKKTFNDFLLPIKYKYM